MVSGSTFGADKGVASNGAAPFFTYEDVFNKHFPYYLAIGMSYEDYWERDCMLVKAYREADEIQKDRRNQELWLNGLYIYDAVLRIAPILQAFAKSGTKPTPYMEKPYDISNKAVENTKRNKEQETFNKGKRVMEQFMALHNHKLEKNKGGEKNE